MVHAGNRTRRWRGGWEHQEGSVFHKRHGRGRECGKARRAMKEMVRKGGWKVAGSLGEPWKIRIRTIVLVYGSKRSGSILQGPGYGTMLPANNFIHDAGNIPL